MNNVLQFAVLLLFAMNVSGITYDVVRYTQYGRVGGLVRTSRINSTVKFFHFLGIPYGRAPVGSLRFQEAVHPIPWANIRNATSSGHPCVQITDEFTGDQVLGDENCLILDIAVPITTRKNPYKLPVMVWIHGGGFLFASSSETQPDPLMEQAVVVVNIQYRLNVFGFLTTEDKHARGNMGLKDQSTALIWIQNNIRNFGGDPKRVTIFGGSAGGASVQFHMLSRRSAGLFHSAISQSGVPINIWVFQRKPREKLQQLAQAFGFENTNFQILIEKLQAIPPDVLIRTAFNQSITGPYLLYEEPPFLPTIEPESNTAFISKSAFKLLQEGKISKVPYMLGEASEEGSYPYTYIDYGAIDINDFEKNPKLLIPLSMNIPQGHQCVNYTINAIHQFFFHGGPFNNKNNWITMMGQDVRGFLKAADLICAKFPNLSIYYYKYIYVGTNNMSYAGGAGHYSEVLKLFYPIKEGWSTVLTDADRDMQKKLVKLWTNFAYYGNPTPEEDGLLQSIKLPTFCNEKFYLEIDNNLVVQRNPSQKVYAFWENLFEKCGFSPYITY